MFLGSSKAEGRLSWCPTVAQLLKSGLFKVPAQLSKWTILLKALYL